jgi:hypothetical protein
VWKELDAPAVKVDAYRRNLQRAYLDVANAKLNGGGPATPAMPGAPAAMFLTSGDEKPLYRAELKALDAALRAALARTADRETKAHLEGARDQIGRILDPRFAAPAAAVPASARGGLQETESCWPDSIIRP